MAGLPAFPREPIALNLSPTTILANVRAYHPKIQALVFLIVSGTLFIFSEYFKNHVEEEGMYFLNIFLIFLVLITGPRPMIRTRQRLMAKLSVWVFALIKGVSAVVSFTYFHWLGKQLTDEKDIFIAMASTFFFLHLLSLRVIYEIADDLGISQGFLISGYSLLLRDYPELPKTVYISAVFAFLLTIMNTPQPPRNQPYDEIQFDPADMPPLEDVYEESDVLSQFIVVRIDGVPTAPANQAVLAIAPSNHRAGYGGWALPESGRWQLPRPNSTNWRLLRPNSMSW